MARHSANNNGDFVHIFPNLVLSCSLLLVLADSLVLGRPTSEIEVGNDYDHGGFAGNFFASTWIGVVVPLSFLIILASLLALCGAGGCCGKIHWFGRTRQEEPLSFSNPMTEPGSTMMVPISQIDVRALELDPIVFEPLPTVHDLTPLPNKTHHGDLRGGHSGKTVIPIVPFSTDDSAVYAHDWFEEPYTNFPRKNIEYVKEIGKGWFGQVIEAEARDIVPFARKIRVIVKLLREDANGIEQMRFLDEARMYRDGDHGNILKLMGHSIEKLPFLLIMEYCPQGDLKSFLISNVIRAEMLNSQGTIVKMALDVSKGLEWLHNAGFIHPDLAARNCQVGSENRVVIGDYGLGTQNFKDDYHWSSSVPIPLRWTAPETLHCTSSVIQILKVTETSNIWTLGVVIWEICEFGKLPYFQLADDEVIHRVIIEKDYLLGCPTLPCMSAKAELYKIMSSCWKIDLESRPRLYTIVRDLEGLYKAFMTSTTKEAHISPLSPSNADEFDSRWEQLGSRSNNSEDDKRRKKNVSFLDLEEQVSRKFDFDEPYFKEDSEASATQGNSSATTLSLNSSDKVAIEENQKDADADEEQWTKKIERGDITQKVLEKSQSVQDLMVLTHFEQNEMGDFDSLPYVTRQKDQHDESSGVSSSSFNGAGGSKLETIDSTVSSSNGTNGETVLKKSNSEPSIDTLSQSNSSQTLTPGSIESNFSNRSLIPEGKSPGVLAPASINNTLTANPPIKINLIEATPNNSATVSSNKVSNSQSPSKTHQIDSSNAAKRRLCFKFDDSSPPTSTTGDLNPPIQFRQRQTSTPLRSGSTPSPRVSDLGEDNCDGGDEDVFKSTSGYYMDGTFGLSPISQSYVSKGSLGNKSMEDSSMNGTSILFGACDDHELGSYQGVKSQIHEISQSEQSKFEQSELDTPQPSTSNESRQLPRRILFPNGTTNGNARSKIDEPSITSSSYDVESTSSGSLLSNETKVGVDSATNEDVSVIPNSSISNGEGDGTADSAEDHDDFWKLQLKSLQMAADSTRELFQTGLDEPTPTSTDDRKFVEDIENDVEELGSLVLHDLEEPDSMQRIIKETREPLESSQNVTAAKLAFEGTGGTASTANSDATNDPFQTGFIQSMASNSSEMEAWERDINNSIEIRKQKTPNKEQLSANSDEVKPLEERFVYAEDGEENGAVASGGSTFTPSKWNQSLIPSRSAIKSPEQQTQPKSSGMKKSVSFEMKKTQLIYQYPPPPAVASDSEEDDQKGISVGPIASASMPLTSSLDWELTQEELEDAEINHEDWDDEVMPKPGDPMDVYRISGFDDDNFQVRCSNEPFVFSSAAPTSTTTTTTSGLGELRHTRDRLRLDLSRGEANFLDDDFSKSSSNPAKLDSGVGSSTNVSPFDTNCDILTKRSKSNN